MKALKFLLFAGGGHGGSGSFYGEGSVSNLPAAWPTTKLAERWLAYYRGQRGRASISASVPGLLVWGGAEDKAKPAPGPEIGPAVHRECFAKPPDENIQRMELPFMVVVPGPL